jgi:hypothetical protein
MKKGLLLSLTAIAPIGTGRGALAFRRRDTSQTQARRLAAAMCWRRGEKIAEIGAGEGSIAVFVAEHVGPSGRIYANDIDPDKVAKIESLAAQRHLDNLISVKGDETSTNLAENSCVKTVAMRYSSVWLIITSHSRRRSMPAFSAPYARAACSPSPISRRIL